MNPFFTFGTHTAGDEPAASWRPLAEVLDDGPVLRERVARVRAVLAAGGGDVELRVAASVAHLGLAARLLSPALALAAEGKGPDYAGAWWQPEVGGAFPLSLPAPKKTADVVGHFARHVLDGPIARLDHALGAFSVAAAIRRGNVASALNGAATMLRQEHPEWTSEVDTIVEQIFALPVLAGTFTREGGRFRRRSCCLIYRAAPDHDGPKCGDCVLLG
ncbi:(2Fe-2S)-binding protein [Amycolatopsis sp. FDAARGOS 1241]|uniref:(2Fe-2S)-binding protein n=1 Tax=Amycolatopsis sp. FDAARGOS 1241 TaxID=2778070 RepID=UPI0019512036|nr:(2Fe-2S)-binding protein [Amycolatopsis sp. FDAARGOS 1241]QRP43184.1 (2Fe-2S)-binding protein [Amycolatopsis sp. FDAARGOS 1241]